MSKKQSNPMPPKGSKRPTPPPAPPSLSKGEVLKKIKDSPCPHFYKNTSIIRGIDGMYNRVECLDCGEILEPEKPKRPTGKLMKESQETKAPQINPKDYLRTLTEGCVKPTEDFIWTRDRNEMSLLQPMKESQETDGDFNWAYDRYKEICGQPIVSDKKVYCKDCKYFLQPRCFYTVKTVKCEDYHEVSYYKVHPEAHIENKYNKCKYYSEKWYIKLWGVFK